MSPNLLGMVCSRGDVSQVSRGNGGCGNEYVFNREEKRTCVLWPGGPLFMYMMAGGRAAMTPTHTLAVLLYFVGAPLYSSGVIPQPISCSRGSTAAPLQPRFAAEVLPVLCLRASPGGSAHSDGRSPLRHQHAGEGVTRSNISL